ncbi:dimethylaniline monooxygenase [N-oxide-forming] 5-like [Dendronephthya gigantea]|uniref:dimethylaniline monooxygenase [N-oxide-forming] 5-like n=1 Tax=Dendronephthya gigantea TaxID=151771 RepID=UPI00106C63BD|nr:dimethylaniline monooxygenase [N-oxide-forming] 5-like [Dendronephthya gigantea]
MTKLRVAIVGAGGSGLTAIKCCLDEGFEPVCFEQETYVGGMWKFTEENSISSSVYRSTVINTSKEMMCYSDFPMPKEFPPFMHNTFVMKYFQLYAQNFGLEKYIRFGQKVLNISRSSDFEKSCSWKVTSKPVVGDSEEIKVEIFDAVMACTGHHWQPSWPTFKGMELFEGVQMHSHSYKDFKGFEEKNVLVIGIGNSGGDIAVELSRHAKQVYLSTRRGSWVLSRLAEGGLPVDMVYTTRFFSYIPKALVASTVISKVNKRFCHSTYSLKPSHSIIGQHPMVNDALPHQIITGSLIVKPNVAQFTKNSAVFDDGSTISNLDAVIFCTGYDMRFPYLEIEPEILMENKVNLYKFVFPPFLKRTTLAVIGNVQPWGAINPISELQSRLACRVFGGQVKLPTEEEMNMDISMKREEMGKRYYATKRHIVQVDFTPYCDELAEMIGCRPDIMKLFLTDPLLALKCLFGPCTPSQYRLMGPGAWSGAKEAIEKAHSNTIYATKTRNIKENDAGSRVMMLVMIAGIILAIIAFRFVV